MALKSLKLALGGVISQKDEKLPAKKKGAKKRRRKPRTPKIKVKQRMPKENELALGLEYIEGQDGKPGVFLQKGIDQKYRSTHCYVVGASGMGKTKFLQFMIIQDIIQQRSFGVIDPHGDLIEDIKGWLYLHLDPQKSLKDHIVLIDPTNPKETATFNPLERIEGIDSADQVAKLIMAFKKIWEDFWGPRMEDLMRNSLIALSEANFTLAEVSLFLTDENFRRKVLEKVENETCLDYFNQRFNQLTQKTRNEWMESTLNKVNAFLSSKSIRHIFSSQKSTFNLREIMDGQKILLVNLNKGGLVDASDLLGSLLMSTIQMTALSRANIPASERTPFYLYVDEFQNFASAKFMETLAESRKYGLSLIMANQNLAQLPRDLIASVLTNCSIQIYFRVSREDADILAKEGFRINSREIKDMEVNENNIRPIYFAYQEEWESHIQKLQDLPERFYFVVQRRTGGLVELQMQDLPCPWELAKIGEAGFKEIVDEKQIGKKYLRKREKIEEEYRQRRKEATAIEEPKSFRERESPRSARVEK